ncbi:energy-coupling factor transporter ATPase [Mycoplasma sp. CSL7503-lung]|uniref:energy-coupling factor transporter ATPase n=1 Tax=Mycoplasma sp. CSL7503-lung TaxID=536372 RepID=UPI0021D26B63|nr:energy-coupling factor transporter ATPase [Mycoplasma sp. CSL7503-lung]MCU4706771.1 energy-coupling factor transporter ATPase [Mycoplasma sp. CSL7503-lung]
MKIEVKKISHIFAKKTPWEFQALDDISAKIEQGEYIGIIGSTGSGKTTFIEHLNLLLEPTEGEIEWFFENDVLNKKTKEFQKQSSIVKFPKTNKNENKIKKIIHKLKRGNKIKNINNLRKKIGIVFQFAEYQLFKNTIEEDIAFGPIAFGVPKDEAYKRAAKCLEIVGLPKEYLKRSPFELSGGQKRRVAIAGILAINPDFMIFDEPTAGLDPVGVKDILEIIEQINKKGQTIINVTHDLDHVLQYAKRVFLLNKGKIIKDGEPYKILSDIKLLEENNLRPPKLLNFIFKLKKRGIDVPEVKSVNELVDFINNGGK